MIRKFICNNKDPNGTEVFLCEKMLAGEIKVIVDVRNGTSDAPSGEICKFVVVTCL